jgi:hypothetical protein
MIQQMSEEWKKKLMRIAEIVGGSMKPFQVKSRRLRLPNRLSARIREKRIDCSIARNANANTTKISVLLVVVVGIIESTDEV